MVKYLPHSTDAAPSHYSGHILFLYDCLGSGETVSYRWGARWIRCRRCLYKETSLILVRLMEATGAATWGTTGEVTSKHEALNQCCFHVGTLAQHWNNIGLVFIGYHLLHVQDVVLWASEMFTQCWLDVAWSIVYDAGPALCHHSANASRFSRILSFPGEGGIWYDALFVSSKVANVFTRCHARRAQTHKPLLLTTQCRFNVGPASSTLAQQWINIWWTPRVCWDGRLLPAWLLQFPSADADRQTSRWASSQIADHLRSLWFPCRRNGSVARGCSTAIIRQLSPPAGLLQLCSQPVVWSPCLLLL